MGHVGRGQRMTAGAFLFAGHAADAPDTAIWDLPIAAPRALEEIHGFAWLDDLAAAGDAAALACAQGWTDDWLTRFGAGAGPGWRADVLGRRIARWIDHAELLMGGDAPRDAALRRSLAAQARLLSRRWTAAPPGSPRIEALCALLLATHVLPAIGRTRGAALTALGREVSAVVAADGTVASRNPEALAALFVRLARLRADLSSADMSLPKDLADALAAMAPVLRSLRHADGGLARFHGGGPGVPGVLDQALAASGTPVEPRLATAMGYARLSHGRTTLLLDAASPPEGDASRHGHAATLAFELTSGRRPLVVNCGAGDGFGDRWRRASRATPSQSTLAIDGFSSARLDRADGHGPLCDTPRDVRIERRRDGRSSGLVAGHDGYVATHGLTHVRQIHLSRDGRGVRGEDVLATVEGEDERIFDRALVAARGPIPFRVRFHLHPDVVARTADDGSSVELMLKSGELWVFRVQDGASMSLQPSIYLDAGLAEPRPTGQIVLSATAAKYATRVSWTLAKARQTPDAVRDTVHEDRPVLV
ncbi:heparinase II/III domain-containing protein [Palleronia rufa]|uniref:heparinase II/III family protein n=1 Tax=Palleronia rufa TaxID=1530186 RepID=UPI001F26E4E1|nr:heparinase II/III family protein [Palleronia rufa]